MIFSLPPSSFYFLNNINTTRPPTFSAHKSIGNPQRKIRKGAKAIHICCKRNVKKRQIEFFLILPLRYLALEVRGVRELSALGLGLTIELDGWDEKYKNRVWLLG